MPYKPFSLDQADKDEAALYARLEELLLGRKDAAGFIKDLAYIAHVWDDLVDRDVYVSPMSVSRAFTKAILGFNSNPFFRQHCDTLVPVLATGILNWHGANDLETLGTPHALQVSHVTRCSVGDAAVLAASLVGGFEHAMTVAAELRMLMQQDSLEDYLADFEAAGKEHTHGGKEQSP
jgi:hypothetical protein